MSDLINLSICLTDIPKERIKQAGNGKKYMNITVARRRAEDAYGNTHTVYMGQSQEERTEKAERIYIGSGKGWDFKPAAATPEDVEKMPSSDDTDDLPF